MRAMLSKPWIKYPLIALGAVAIMASGIVGIFAYFFIPWVKDADFPEPTSSAEAYAQDLRYLARYAAHEKAFDDPAKQEAFHDALARIRSELDSMTPARFELAVAQAVALADNGHSNVSPLGRSRRVNQLPVRFGPFEDGEFVLQARREHADLLGAELLAVGEHPVAEVTAAFVPTFGGVERRARFFMHVTITSPALLHAKGFTTSPDTARLTFRLRNGEVVTRALVATAPEQGRRQPFGREVMDYRVPSGDEDGWVHLMDGQEAPNYLAHPDEPYLYRVLEQQNGAYVKINFNANVAGRSLVGWLDSVMTDLAVRRPAFAVVDLRFNGGGTDATADFAKRLPTLVQGNGPIYVLTSRETFSAAIGAAAQLKHFAGARTRVVGGLVGDRLRFVANGGTPLTLPNSKISIAVWSAWEDYADGCWEWTECFWLSPFFKTRGVGHLEPDLPVAMRFSDYVQHRDAALDAVLADAVIADAATGGA